MKNYFKIFVFILILFVLSFKFNFANYFISNYVLAEQDSGKEENEKDEDREDEEDGDEDEEEISSGSRNVQIAPVKKVINTVTENPVVTPAVVVTGFESPIIDFTQKVSKNTPPPIQISENRLKELFLESNKFEGRIEEINLEEVSNDIFSGSVITTQKLLGVFDIQIPYNIEFNSSNNMITKNIDNSYWLKFLDILSY